MSRALLIGIDHYEKAPLDGCVNDAKNMERVLSRHHDGTKNFHCIRLTSDEHLITEALIRENVEVLLKREEEVALFYFAGHGAEDSRGGILVGQDSKRFDRGFRLSELIEMINDASQIREALVILDCCHAGYMGNLSSLNSGKAVMRKGVSILTASLEDEYAAEKDGKGLFTSIVIDALMGGAADIMGEITTASIYNYADKLLGPWEQRPVFKSHVSQLRIIRKAKPDITVNEIREIIVLFSAPQTDYKLTPKHEHTVDGYDPELSRQFKLLQKYNSANLVEPVGEEYMYDAAMNYKACRLTLLGQFYWQMVKMEKY